MKLRKNFRDRHLANTGARAQTPRMPKRFQFKPVCIALIAGLPTIAFAQAASSSARRAHSLPADMIVVNGRVYTVDDSRPMVSAFAVRGGRIMFAGSDREVRSLAGPGTKVVDVLGATVIPGMVDAHAHLLGLGTSLANVNLAGSESYDEVISRVVARKRH